MSERLARRYDARAAYGDRLAVKIGNANGGPDHWVAWLTRRSAGTWRRAAAREREKDI